MSRDFELIKQQIHTQFEGEHAYLPLEQQRPWLAISAGISLNKVSLIAKLLAALQEQPYQQGGGISEEKWPQYGQVLPAVGLWDQHLKALSVALEELQWLHDIRLSSEEYQAAHTLSNSITTLQGLCSDLPPITAARFITLWELNLSLTVFQPQSLTDKKMVLGLLEAAALPWDAVWITKACFEHFPPPLNPHPLLPYDWQVQGQLPQAHPGREWAYFQKLLQRLILTVSDKTISQGTPDPLSAAPLWQMWDLLPAERGPELFFEKKQLRLRPEFFQPQAVSYPGKTLTVSQMNALSQCPFKGWALSLPQARPVQPAHPVFDPRIWGQITHIWVQQYLQLGKSDLRGNPNFRQWPLPLQHYAQKILTAATAQIAEKTPWQNERDILKIEQAFRWELTPELALEGRADLLWESCRVVDIKTSTPILSHWFNESPKDWQGAIYALALGVPALGLLRISASGMQYWEKDVSDRSALWEEQLLALAQRWEAGLYHPSPIDKATCAHCPFQASCRYHLEEIASCL